MTASRFAGLPDDALIGQLHAGIGQAPEGELLAAADTLAAITGPVPTVLPVAGCAQPALDTLLDATTLPRRGADLVFVVYGDPAPQGSKSAKGSYTDAAGKRHVRLVESSKRVKPWRERVEAAVREALAGRTGFPLAGPLEIGALFTLPRPGRMPKERIVGGIALPMCYPDLSKLLRSTEDAITKAGAWLDDAQVVNCREFGKRYAGEPGALESPGAVVRVWQIGGAR